MNLKQALENELTKEELNLLKTAYDTVGSIAILEIPDELVKKESAIAQAILRTRKNVKTVLKKGGIHAGKFRTQKMIFLAGDDTRETIHKEHGIRLMLDVEKVYFSPRTSTERERITKQVKDGENVLVMFSGCAPLPCTIAKHASPHQVIGVELNPLAHIYGEMNIKLNKLKNVELIKGDVDIVVPNMYPYLIGLKSDDSQKELKQRLKKHPRIMELHLWDTDLFAGRKKLERTIQDLQKKHIEVFMHMPFTYKGDPFDLSQEDISNELEILRVLGEICKQYMIKAIVHPLYCNTDGKYDEARIVRNLKLLKRHFDYFYFENITRCGFNTVDDVLRIAKKVELKNLCIDIAHYYVTYKDTDTMVAAIKKVQKKYNTYFHVSDSDGKTDAMDIGKGKIDFKKILPLINKGVTEVRSKDEMHPIEMLHSYETLEHKQKKFDRILMPLPKSAEDFLDTALKAAKKGTIVHFYDFLREAEFHLAHEKIDKACKKNKMRYKIVNTVKCGSHAPYVFRICVDFKIL